MFLTVLGRAAAVPEPPPQKAGTWWDPWEHFPGPNNSSIGGCPESDGEGIGGGAPGKRGGNARMGREAISVALLEPGAGRTQPRALAVFRRGDSPTNHQHRD